MKEDYLYSAYTYLDEWLAIDRDLRISVGYREGEAPRDEIARRDLVRGVQFYGVARNFRVAGDEPRLGRAWDALKLVSEPTNRHDAIIAVLDFMEVLRSHYGKNLLSAASKLLWFRFGSPVIIYDSLAWNWMCREGGCRKGGSYEDYCDAWYERFAEQRERIEMASLEVLTMKKFLRPNSISNAELAETVRSAWFVERVFDHSMLNAEAAHLATAE